MCNAMDSMYHLRRVNFQTFTIPKEKGANAADKFIINDKIVPSTDPSIQTRSTLILLDKVTKIGRNPDTVDVVLHSTVHSNMISRFHAEINGEVDDNNQYTCYFINDKSLNGTYINDTRVDGRVCLREGDLIKFGHVNGAAVKPGDYAPQPISESEFVFIFERAISGQRYFGYTETGHLRITCAQDKKRAYMQINSDRIAPIEVFGTTTITTSTAHSNLNQNQARLSLNGQQPTPLIAAPILSFVQTQRTPSNLQQNGTATSTTNTTHSSRSQAQSQSLPIVDSFVSQAQSTIAANNSAIAQLVHPQPQLPSSMLNSQALAAAAANLSTEEFNAQLRQFVASESILQHWNILKLSGLQQPNAMTYGASFPAAAAAALLNTNSAASYATLWPNIAQQCRVALQPNPLASASSYVGAAQFQPQLRMQGLANLYQSLPSAAGAVSSLSNNNNQLTPSIFQPAFSSNATQNGVSGAPITTSIFSFNGHNMTTSPISNNTITGSNSTVQNNTTFSSQPVSSSAYSSCTSSVASVKTAIPNGMCNGDSPLSSLSNAANVLSRGHKIGPIAEGVTKISLEKKAALSMAVPSTSTGLRGSSSADISSILPKLGRGHKSASVSSTPVPLNISNNSTSTIVDSSPTCISSVAQKIPNALATVAMAQTSSAGNSNIGIEISPRLFLNNGVRPNSTSEINPETASAFSSLQNSISNSSNINDTPTQPLLITQRLVDNQRQSSVSMGSSGIGSSCSSTQSALLHSPSEKLDPMEFRYTTPAQVQPTTLNSLAAAMFKSNTENASNDLTKSDHKHQRKWKSDGEKKHSLRASPSTSSDVTYPLKIITTTLNEDVLVKEELPPFACTPDAASSHDKSPSSKSNLLPSASASVPDKNILESEVDLFNSDHPLHNPKSLGNKSKGSNSELIDNYVRNSSASSSNSQHTDSKPTLKGKDRINTYGRRERQSSSEMYEAVEKSKTSKSIEKPIRKSNEVARLLNDLTAGNCSWQYQAERQQKKLARAAARGKAVAPKQGPLRLEERKLLEIRKRKAHKLMRQISDESSDSDPENERRQSVTVDVLSTTTSVSDGSESSSNESEDNKSTTKSMKSIVSSSSKHSIGKVNAKLNGQPPSVSKTMSQKKRGPRPRPKMPQKWETPQIQNISLQGETPVKIERRGRPRKKRASSNEPVESSPYKRRHDSKRNGSRTNRTMEDGASKIDVEKPHVDDDDWHYHDPDNLCAHKQCKQPQSTSITWVQCDSCDSWYHTECIGSDIELDDDVDFNCGCK